MGPTASPGCSLRTYRYTFTLTHKLPKNEKRAQNEKMYSVRVGTVCTFAASTAAAAVEEEEAEEGAIHTSPMIEKKAIYHAHVPLHCGCASLLFLCPTLLERSPMRGRQKKTRTSVRVFSYLGVVALGMHTRIEVGTSSHDVIPC